MKRLYILLLSFAVIFIGVLYLSSFKSSTNQFKTIYQSYGYVYKEGKKMEFDLYSKDNASAIENVNNNSYYLSSLDIRISLNEVEVTKQKVGNYQLYKISCSIIKPIEEELIINDVKLIIETNEFTLDIILGGLSIYNGNLEQLSFNDVYASYTYINNSLILCGINVGLNDDYKRISNLTINGVSFTDTSMIVDGSFYGNEVEIRNIIPNYQYNSILRSFRKIETKKLFIPVTYKELIVIKGGYIIITLDGIDYLINEFDFIFNDLDINNYDKYIKESINVKA